MRNTDRSGKLGRIRSFNSRADARSWPNGFSTTIRLSFGNVTAARPRRTPPNTVGGRARYTATGSLDSPITRPSWAGSVTSAWRYSTAAAVASRTDAGRWAACRSSRSAMCRRNRGVSHGS